MTSGSGDVSRRSWDVDAYERRAKERKRAESEAEQEKLRARKASRQRPHIGDDPFAPTRAWLQKRDHSIDFESKVGSSEIVGSIQGGGFTCKTCDVTLKDSNRYLAHVNSKAHQKALGMSMRVKRSTPEEVRLAFQKAAKERDESKQRKNKPMATLKDRIEKTKEQRRGKRAAERSES